MTDIVKRLRNPPFGTETSERNLMTAAADEIERLRQSVQPTASVEAVAWRYELAGAVRHNADGTKTGENWKWHLTEYKPNVPDWSIRNLVALGALASLTPAPTQGDENTTAVLVELANERATPSPAPVSAPATDGEVRRALRNLLDTVKAMKNPQTIADVGLLLWKFTPVIEQAERALSNPTPGHGEAVPCDCERGHNGIGLTGRECDCHPATGEKPAPATGKE